MLSTLYRQAKHAIVLCVLTLFSLAPIQARADYVTNHIYVTGTDNTSYDVTTPYNNNGGMVPIPGIGYIHIYPDWSSGIVYDASLNVVGFVYF